MTTTLDMFAELKPLRAKPRVLMHVDDAGEVSCGAGEDLSKPMCIMRCRRCETVTDWLVFTNVTEAKRGIPCEKCNSNK